VEVIDLHRLYPLFKEHNHVIDQRSA